MRPAAVLSVLNADGRPDLVSANTNTNGDDGNAVLTNTTAAGAAVPSFTGPVEFDAVPAPCDVTAADLDAAGPPATSWRLTRGGRTRAAGTLRGRSATLRLGRLAPGRYTLRSAGRRAATIRVSRRPRAKLGSAWRRYQP